jgi:hypothetical protein
MFAKSQPPDGQNLMDGLKVKVMGSVWKQSLTELSGGQLCVYATLSWWRWSGNERNGNTGIDNLNHQALLLGEEAGRN